MARRSDSAWPSIGKAPLDRAPLRPVVDLPPTLLAHPATNARHAGVARTDPHGRGHAVLCPVDGDAAAGAQSEQVVHESLSLDRFDSRWVQTLLPFRMWRRRTFRDA